MHNVSMKWYTLTRCNDCENFRTERRRNCHLASNHRRRIAYTYYCNRHLLYTTSVSAHAICIIDALPSSLLYAFIGHQITVVHKTSINTETENNNNNNTYNQCYVLQTSKLLFPCSFRKFFFSFSFWFFQNKEKLEKILFIFSEIFASQILNQQSCLCLLFLASLD